MIIGWIATALIVCTISIGYVLHDEIEYLETENRIIQEVESALINDFYLKTDSLNSPFGDDLRPRQKKIK